LTQLSPGARTTVDRQPFVPQRRNALGYGSPMSDDLAKARAEVDQEFAQFRENLGKGQG
jgi:hypothetical protein